MALPLYVYARTGSAVSTGLTFASSTLPGLLVAPVAGVMVDRWNRRTTMIIADLGRASLLAVLLVGPDRRTIWIVFVVVGGQACLSQFFNPARTAAVPVLVAPSRLSSANSKLAAGSQVALLGGPALGGLVYAWTGLRMSVSLDIATYLISAATVTAIRTPEFRLADPTPVQVASGASAVLRDLRGGLSVARHSRALRALLATTVVLFVAGGLLAVVIVAFARAALHASGAQYGLVLSAQAVGGLAGTAVAGRAFRGASPRTPMAVSLYATAMAVALLGVTTRWWMAAICLAAGGVPTTISGVITNTVLQVESGAEYRGRLAALYATTVSVGALIGTTSAGLVISATDAAVSMEIAAAVFAASATVALVAFPPPRHSQPDEPPTPRAEPGE